MLKFKFYFIIFIFAIIFDNLKYRQNKKLTYCVIAYNVISPAPYK